MAAAAHEVPDRIPVDFSANPGTVARLHRDLGTSTLRELLDQFHVDMIDLRGVVEPEYRGPVPYETVHEDGTTENFWGMRTRVMEAATGPETCYCQFPLAEATSLEALEAHCWPEASWFDFSHFAERLEPWTDLAVMAASSSVFQHVTFLRGIDNLLADLVGAPDMAEFLMDRFTDFYCDFFDQMLTAAAGRIDILRIADDLAMQDRLLISPAMFDRFIGPRIARLTDVARRHHAKVLFHSCGAVVPLIDRLIDVGVDILDPVQVSAKDMDPVELKCRFGKRLAFHGGIDTQYLLPQGTPAEVAESVRQTAQSLGPDGYILCASHILQTDVPTANIKALYDSAHALAD